MCVCITGGKKCSFFGKFCVCTEWMISYNLHDLVGIFVIVVTSQKVKYCFNRALFSFFLFQIRQDGISFHIYSGILVNYFFASFCYNPSPLMEIKIYSKLNDGMIWWELIHLIYFYKLYFLTKNSFLLSRYWTIFYYTSIALITCITLNFS